MWKGSNKCSSSTEHDISSGSDPKLWSNGRLDPDQDADLTVKLLKNTV